MIENQLSTKFKGINLGFSKVYTINDSGCLTACIARLLNLPLLEVHQKLKDGGCFFSECLLDLTKVPTVFPSLTYIGKSTYSLSKAQDAIKKYGIVIAEVDYNPTVTGVQQHFVCMVGGGNIEDPLGGKIKPVSTYPVYISLRVFEIKQPVSNSEDNMTEEQRKVLEIIETFYKNNEELKNGNLEGAANALVGWAKDLPDKNKQIQTLQSRVLDLEKSLKDLTDRMTALESNIEADLKLITDWQQKYQSANKSLENANKTNQELIIEKNQWKSRYEAKLQETVDKQPTSVLLSIVWQRLLKLLGKK